MTDQFVGDYQHTVDEQNTTAMVAVAIVAGRALVLVGGRLVWHIWDKARGIGPKVDDMADVELTEEMVTDLQQQQQQQQQTTITTTPPNNTLKVDANGELRIYSNSPKLTPDFLPKFEASNDYNDNGARPSCQFGPPMLTTTTMTLQEQQDIAQATLNSYADGKGQTRFDTDRLQDNDWGYKNGGDLAATTANARMKILEDKLLKTEKERHTYKRHAERQTTTTNTTEPHLMTNNVFISILAEQHQITKERMVTIENGGICEQCYYQK